MDPITTRRLGPEDAALVVASGDTVFDAAPTPEGARAFLADPGHLLIGALGGDRLVGFASATRVLHPDKPPQAFLNELGVAETHRRRGIAARLVAALRQEAARLWDAGEVWTLTEADNAPALAAYRSTAPMDETGGLVMFDWDDGTSG